MNLFKALLFSLCIIIYPCFASTINGLYFIGGAGYGLQAPFNHFEHTSFSRSQLVNFGITASLGVGYKFSRYLEAEIDVLKGEDVSLKGYNDDVIKNNYAAVCSLWALLPVAQKVDLDLAVGVKYNYYVSDDGFTLKQGNHDYVVKPGEQVEQIAPEVLGGVSFNIVNSLNLIMLSRYDFQYMKSPESYSFELALRWLV